MTRTYKLAKVKHENLLESLKFLHEKGFSKEEMLSYPPVFKIHPATLEQKYLLLKESGFLKVSPKVISKLVAGGF